MSGRVAHQLTDDGVTVVLRPEIGSPSSLRVSLGEARRFAWSLLADVDPDGLEPTEPDEGSLAVGPLVMDAGTLAVRVNGKPLRLTRKEFRVLWVIAAAGSLILSSEIHLAVYGTEERRDGIVNVWLHKIRTKLAAIGERDLITTDMGRGFSIRIAAEIAA